MARLGTAALVVLVVFVGGQIAGIGGLAYVETDSMEPTLSPGDGFVALPTALAGPIEEGDVVVYRPRELNSSQLTTHRVVDQTGAGYITKGDANPFTDQDNREPPVPQERIVAKALEVGGHLVVIPGLGVVVTTIQVLVLRIQQRLALTFGSRAFLGTSGLLAIFAMGTFVVYIVGRFSNSGQKRARGSMRGRFSKKGYRKENVVLGISLLLIGGATIGTVGASSTDKVEIISSHSSDTGIQPGHNETGSYEVENGGYTPMTVVVQARDTQVTVSPGILKLAPGESANASVTLTAPDDPGKYRWTVRTYWYPAILPNGVVSNLFALHPWTPIVVIDVLLGVSFYLLGVRLIGTGRIHSRARDGPSRIKRFVSRLT